MDGVVKSTEGETHGARYAWRAGGEAWKVFRAKARHFDELESGRRFLERSTMLSMRCWEHERTLTPVAGGTRVHDRVTFRPRLPIPGLAALLERVVDAFFRHRHRRLQEYFGK